MANNINVTLDTTVTPNLLHVADHGGQNHVDQSPNPQTISWNLTGNMARGAFDPITSDPATSGFSWISAPPAGVFGIPVVTSNGNGLSITDTHSSAATSGTWTYQLRASLAGQCYTTYGAVNASGSLHDPVIINR